jgi:hypothetical protein
MNKVYYFLLAVCTIGSAHAQNCSVKKGSAYERSTISGTIPRKIVDESGSEVERPVKKMNTSFIYIETEPGCHILPTRIWIGGKAYVVIQEEITNTPVIIQNAYPGISSDTLVKQTINKVFRLHSGEELQIKPDKNLAKKLADAKIVIEYTSNFETRYYIIKDIKRLAPLVLQ